jgi:hypothetical protein
MTEDSVVRAIDHRLEAPILLRITFYRLPGAPMSEVLRVLIEQSLETMEGGRFQDFCLEFLPVYNTRFAGLSRVGHTAGGKTRAGTPDLLKADSSGQTGVQCGTDEDYWPTEDSIEGSKPFEDGMKCIRVLELPGEIVLVTNRETPARTPNIKLLLATALQSSTEARITILGREDLSQFMITHLEDQSVRRLVSKFCPVATMALEAGEHAEHLQVLGAVAESRGWSAPQSSAHREELRVAAAR